MKNLNRRLNPFSSRTALALVSAAGIALMASLPGCGSSSRANFGQESTAPATIESISTTPRVDLPGRVSVTLRVIEADGTPAAGLDGSDFDIYENGSLVSQSESFQQIQPQPQFYRSYLHLVLDRSNSVQTTGETALKAGAREFVELLAQDDETTFIKISWFDGSADIFPIPGHDIGYTDSRADLLAAIDDLDREPPTNGSTNLYGAIVSGIADLDLIDVQAQLAGVDNRSLTLVTFTDGTHQSGASVSLGDARAAIAATSTAGTPHSAFTIGVGQEIDPEILALLGPDGSVAESNLGALTTAFLNIGGQVRDLANSFYFLTYCSPKTSGFNTLTISVVGDPNAPGNAEFTFDAEGFGAGCAFLDVRTSEEVGNGEARMVLSDSIEAADGSVYAVGWRTAGCLEPGCGSDATAFIAKFKASPASSGETGVDGRLDLSFGSGGVLALQDLAFDVSGATSIVRSSLVSGGFAIGGWARASSTSGFSKAVIWEVDANGTTAARTDLPNLGGMTEANQAITDLIVLAGGEYAAGGFYGTSQRAFAVWRLFPNFDLDMGFGTAGVVLGPGGAFNNRGVKAVALGAGSRVYACGNLGSGIRVLALDGSSGALVPAFDGDGILDLSGIVAGSAYPARLGGIAVDGQGRLLLAGSITGAPPQVGAGTAQPALWRLLSTGALDTSFTGSVTSPTSGTGLVTLRSSVTDQVNDDFGRDTMLHSVAFGPDGTIIAGGERTNSQAHTDLAMFAFDDIGISAGDYNFVGFLIHDGAVSDKSFEYASMVRILSSGAIWALGVGYPTEPSTTSAAGVRSGVDVPVIWVDRDPLRAFSPLGD
ncbi:MAG: hypothetical protein ACJA2W_000291 [Planctomycetota bacterium]|jgi:hypothetical protein